MRFVPQLEEQKEYWDGRLKQAKKWRLAPSHLIAKGVVNDKNYRTWTLAFRSVIKAFMQGYIESAVTRTRPDRRVITYVGFGDGHDASWWKFARSPILCIVPHFFV